MKLSNQEIRVIQYCSDFGSITAWEAAKELGVMRLSAVIYNLKDKGYIITDRYEDAINRYGDKVHFKRYIINGKSLVLQAGCF